jgi:hypothetical protein
MVCWGAVFIISGFVTMNSGSAESSSPRSEGAPQKPLLGIRPETLTIISRVLSNKRKTDPVGLIRAKQSGTMSEFLADEMLRYGLNSNDYEF